MSILRRLIFILPVTAMLSVGFSGQARCQESGSVEDYLKANDFSPYVPPRGGDGAGAIIRIDQHGWDSEVSSPGHCLPTSHVPVTTEPVVLLDETQKTAQSFSIAAGLPALLSRLKLSLSAAFGIDHVYEIHYTLLDPELETIQLADLLNYINTLNRQDVCYRALYDTSNLVTNKVLVAKGVQVSFYNNAGGKISISAAILKAIHFSVEAGVSYENGSILLFEQPGNGVSLGYRSWEAQDMRGALSSGIQFIDIPPEEIAARRQAAAQQP